MEETQLVALISFIEPEHSENEIGTNSQVPVSFRVKEKTNIVSYGRQK